MIETLLGMATTNTDLEGDVNQTFHTGAGLVMLSLAQATLIFTVWVVVWPSSFGIPETFHIKAGIAGFFTGAALLGFYLGFGTLTGQVKSRSEY